MVHAWYKIPEFTFPKAPWFSATTIKFVFNVKIRAHITTNGSLGIVLLYLAIMLS